MEAWKHVRAVLLLPFMVTVVIPVVEEPMLVKQFGDEYEEYRRNVPRWMPRMTRWEGNATESE